MQICNHILGEFLFPRAPAFKKLFHDRDQSLHLGICPKCGQHYARYRIEIYDIDTFTYLMPLNLQEFYLLQQHKWLAGEMVRFLFNHSDRKVLCKFPEGQMDTQPASACEIGYAGRYKKLVESLFKGAADD